MEVNNKEVNTLKINNKLVKSIKRLSDNKIIYDMPKTEISLDENDFSIIYGDTCVISGTLLKTNGELLKNKTIKLKNGSSTIATTTTNSNGIFSMSLNLNAGTYHYSVVFDGDSTSLSCSEEITIEIRQGIPQFINISTPTNAHYGDTINISGKLVDDRNRPISNVNVEYNDNSSSMRATTDTNGNFSFSVSVNSFYDVYGYLTYSGNNNYEYAEQGLNLISIYQPTVKVTSSTSGSNLVVKLQLCDTAGQNLSIPGGFGNVHCYNNNSSINSYDYDNGYEEIYPDYIIFNSNGYTTFSFQKYSIYDKIEMRFDIDAASTNFSATYVWSKILWQPALDGTTGANYKWSYSESNGEGVGKGFTLKEGFPNDGLWELSFDFKHDNIRYTGIVFLAQLGSNGVSGTKLSTWEGTWTGGSAYASYTSGTVGWFDVKVTKIDDTHVRLRSTTLNRDTTVEVLWLPNITTLTCGASHNTGSSSFGPCRIKNVKVVRL